MAAEVPLKDFSLLGAIKHGATGFQFPNARGRLLRVQFGHAPVVDILAAAHRVGKVNFPVVGWIHCTERRSNATFRHHRVCFAKQRLANQTDLDSRSRCFNRGTESRPACPDDQHVVLGGLILRH